MNVQGVSELVMQFVTLCNSNVKAGEYKCKDKTEMKNSSFHINYVIH